jgi:hypothetical protein
MLSPQPDAHTDHEQRLEHDERDAEPDASRPASSGDCDAEQRGSEAQSISNDRCEDPALR